MTVLFLPLVPAQQLGKDKVMTTVAETNGTVKFDQTLTDTRAIAGVTGFSPAPTLDNKIDTCTE